MANYNESLEAVDCHLHSVRYDMAVKRGIGGRLRCIIRSPKTLLSIREGIAVSSASAIKWSGVRYNLYNPIITKRAQSKAPMPPSPASFVPAQNVRFVVV
eukprot:scaffold3601_cov83-Skeletonema_dohrnii-CCMP3373.AAC.2